MLNFQDLLIDLRGHLGVPDTVSEPPDVPLNYLVISADAVDRLLIKKVVDMPCGPPLVALKCYK